MKIRFIKSGYENELYSQIMEKELHSLAMKIRVIYVNVISLTPWYTRKCIQTNKCTHTVAPVSPCTCICMCFHVYQRAKG